MTTRKRWLLGSVVVVACLLGGAATVVRLLGPKLKAVAVVQQEIVQTVIVSGRVLPTSRINVGSLLAGVVAKVAVKEGDHVQTGDLLVQLDDADARAAVVVAKAGLQQARARMAQLDHVTAPMARDSHRQADANLVLAQLSYERQLALLKNGGTTVAQRDESKRALAVAQGQHDATETQAISMGSRGADHRMAVAFSAQAAASVAQSEVRVAQSRIVAATPARVLIRSVEPGELVQPGRALLVLARDGSTLLSIQPDEKSLADLRLSQIAKASADAFAAQSFAASVVYIAPSIDPQRGTVEVRLAVPEVPAYLRTDMTVSVNIEVGRHEHALLIPTSAVRDLASSKPWVWLFTRGSTQQLGRIQHRSVQLGLRSDDRVEITQGLQLGDLVISSEGQGLTAGQRVRASTQKGS